MNKILKLEGCLFTYLFLNQLNFNTIYFLCLNYLLQFRILTILQKFLPSLLSTSPFL